MYFINSFIAYILYNLFPSFLTFNNKKMNEKQALQILKEVLDAATKSGVFPNIDASFAAANAYNIISQKILPKEITPESVN